MAKQLYVIQCAVAIATFTFWGLSVSLFLGVSLLLFFSQFIVFYILIGYRPLSMNLPHAVFPIQIVITQAE